LSIVEKLKGKRFFVCLKGAKEEEIDSAQRELGLRFADEYIEYLSAFGVASFDGHELTGICDSERLNVVAVTRRERGTVPSLSDDLYVIEQENIDDAVIWQDASGKIYQTLPDAQTVILCDSLSAYIDL